MVWVSPYANSESARKEVKETPKRWIGGIKQEREAATEAAFIKQLLLWATGALSPLGKAGRHLFLCKHIHFRIIQLGGQLIFIHCSVGHWLRAAGFGKCKFSASPGLPNRQEKLVSMVRENPKAEKCRCWHLETRLDVSGVGRGGGCGLVLGYCLTCYKFPWIP